MGNRSYLGPYPMRTRVLIQGHGVDLERRTLCRQINPKTPPSRLGLDTHQRATHEIVHVIWLQRPRQKRQHDQLIRRAVLPDLVHPVERLTQIRVANEPHGAGALRCAPPARWGVGPREPQGVIGGCEGHHHPRSKGVNVRRRRWAMISDSE